MIADRQTVDSRAYGVDDTRALVAHHQRNRGLPLTLAHMQIAVAHTCTGDADAHLTCLRIGQFNILDGDGLIC
jgi:hypothetical protein